MPVSYLCPQGQKEGDNVRKERQVGLRLIVTVKDGNSCGPINTSGQDQPCGTAHLSVECKKHKQNTKILSLFHV